MTNKNLNTPNRGTQDTSRVGTGTDQQSRKMGSGSEEQSRSMGANKKSDELTRSTQGHAQSRTDTGSKIGNPKH